MTTPYGYVHIISDDDWGLVGIVPPSRGFDSPNRKGPGEIEDVTNADISEYISKGTSKRKLPSGFEEFTNHESINPPRTISTERALITENNSFVLPKSIIVPADYKKQQQIASTKELRYAESINRSKTNNSTNESDIVNYEDVNIGKSSKSNPNILTGLDFSQNLIHGTTSELSDNSEYRSLNSSYNVSETVGFGNISSLATIHNNSVALVGFGK
jgi:hypothetical protein